MKLDEAILFYVCGLMDEMRRCGFIDVKMHFTELGLSKYKGLREDKFEPTDKEMESAVASLVGAGNVDKQDAGILIATIKMFDKDPDREERIKRVESGLSPFFNEE